jgi:hypothetical protein
MRLSKWMGLAAVIGVAGVVATPRVQSAIKAQVFRNDPMASSDAASAAAARTGETLGDRRLPAGVGLPAGISARIGNGDGTMNVMVELDGAPAVVAYSQARENAAAGVGADAAAVGAARSQVAAIESAQQGVLSGLRGLKVDVLYRVQRAYNGIAVRATARQLGALRALPGVKAVHRITPLYPTNWNSVPFIGAPAVWVNGLGHSGTGVKVGVIDTGIDYLHSNFGGPGAAADYHGLDPGNPASYNVFNTVGDDPNYPGFKVAGGTDFVGDAYNGSNTPVPDDDPMDCNGHGSHVAGTIGGLGVNADGTTYSGAYGPGTPFSTLKIGPGVAPTVTLYALRVFGCGGSTGVVPEALDWAVDPNGDGDFSDHLDVVNMSLGSSFGGPDDPSAVASDNASLAGVLVAAASGNSGDTRHHSSPASTVRAISVALRSPPSRRGGGELAEVLAGRPPRRPPGQPRCHR